MKNKDSDSFDHFVPSEGIRLQKELRGKVVLKWNGGKVQTVAGADVHFPQKKRAKAAITLLSYPGLELINAVTADIDCPVPYIPGLLSFREIPAILKAWSGLKSRPDVILCDGQGIAHPRGLGLASHLGLELGVPTIGCAKSPLFGYFREPGTMKGEKSPIRDKEGDVIGFVLRTRENVKPVYVSPGHLVGLDKAVEIVMRCAPRYKIPEPLRHAHHLAGRSF